MKFDQRSQYPTESSTMTTRLLAIAVTRIVLHNAADDRRSDASPQRHPDERRVRRFRHERRFHFRRRIWIEDRDVADAASLQRSAGQPEDARRTARHQLDETSEPDDLAAHEDVVAHRERRFESDDAEWCEVELDVLLVEVMRSVIGRDRIDGFVGDSFE